MMRAWEKMRNKEIIFVIFSGLFIAYLFLSGSLKFPFEQPQMPKYPQHMEPDKTSTSKQGEKKN